MENDENKERSLTHFRGRRVRKGRAKGWKDVGGCIRTFSDSLPPDEVNLSKIFLCPRPFRRTNSVSGLGEETFRKVCNPVLV